MDIPKLVFKGSKPGPRLLVLGAIHGNETAGPAAIRRLAAELEARKIVLTAGELTMVPVCNQKAYRQNTRYVDENLNRVFRKHSDPTSYEQRCANRLTDFFAGADYVLDLHSQHVDGQSYCFAQNNSRKLLDFVRALGPECIIFDWAKLYPEGDFTTESYAESLGAVGTTVECGNHTNPKTVDVAYDTILRALVHLGMIPSESVSKPNLEALNLYMTKKYDFQAGGRLAKAWQHLDYLPAGAVVATLEDGTEIKAAEDSYMILPKLTDNRPGEEWFYLAV
ncbi:MAG: succinylglutamate desuccinylase/aspartoacylase family protein [Candidatus Nomurabacteria bacterium]|jgi:predicted deacylase|nr:succinylglutamate desuccinylase/aspartoacylase family protein [Candidatus Nomurabacteria bacterium]